MLGGCFLDRSALDPDQSADAGVDVPDAAHGDAGHDGGPLVRDGGPIVPDAGPPDSGPRDGGPSCTAADERCDGERAITCGPSGLTTIDCTLRGSYCDATGGPHCVLRACTPSTTACSADGTSVIACDARGTASTTTACPRGCASGACRPVTPCASAVAGTITTSGTLSIDLCGAGNDSDYADASSDDCRDSNSADGEDVFVRLELDRRRTVGITVRDNDGSRAVDPVTYIRRACGDAAQIICDDDVGGGDLSSAIDVELEAGDYVIVVDSFDYTNSSINYGCGNVTLNVTAL